MSSIAREFSPDGRYCAYISQQGKFIVYEVETGTLHQVYTPNMHLNVPCTCFTWLEVATDQPAVATPRTGKAKKQRNSAKQLMAAFGTSRGRVAFYSLATGTIERSCQGDGHSAPVTAICFNAAADPDTLLTAGADGKVIEWSIMQSAQGTVHNIGVEKLSCVMLASSDVIVTGSKQLKLWDRTESRLLRTLVGHTSNTQILRALTATTTTTEEIESFALSGSVLDRNVSMWSLNADGENTQPVASFALDDVPEYVSLELVERKMHLVAVSRTGVAHYFMRSLDKLSVKRPYRANHTFQIAVDTATTKTKAVDRLPVFVASVQHSPQPETIMLGYGTEASLRFEPIPIDAELKINVIIREPIKLLGKSKQEGDLKTKTPIVDANSAEYLNPVNANKKNMKKVEIPMEVRLENLSLLPDRSDTKMVTGRKNMIHLLVQGLHSRDATILRSVFGRNDPEMIQQTVERIPAQYLGALLSEMSYLMQLKTVHVQTAVCWLKQLITVHASQLMALGASNLMTNFATCLGIIEYRVEHLNSLAKLRGRLGLLIDQADRSKKQSINRNVDENVLVYQEEDDSDVDSVLGTDNEQPGSSNEDIYDGDEQESPEYDDDEEQENPASDAGLSVRKQNGFAQEDEEHDGNDSDDSEEMEVSD